MVGYRSVRLHQGVRSQLLTPWFAYASCCQDVCCNLCAILEINRAYKLSAPDFMTICLYEITVNSNVVEFLCKKSGAPNDCFFFLLPRIFYFFRTATNLDDYSTHVQFSYLIYYFPIDYLRFNFSHFTFQVRLFSVEKKKP